MGKRQDRIISGLAEALGLVGVTPFEIMKTAAEALGCEVHADGTTTVEGDEVPGIEEAAAPPSKRARHDAEEHESASDSGDDGSPSGSEAVSEPSSSDADAFDAETAHLFTNPVCIEDPRKRSKAVTAVAASAGGPSSQFAWLIAPLDVASWEEGVFQQQPLLVRRPRNRTYYAGFLSKADIDTMLRSPAGLQYSYQVDVTHYVDGARINFNYNAAAPPAQAEDGSAESSAAPERADADVVWRRFNKEGCSVRLLHPQRSSDALHRLLWRLEAYFGCCGGCNAYLTPPGSQGFAPHFDDIDAFVLQVEGAKRWRLYAPTTPQCVLPRHSSRDFQREELGECVLEVVLQPGDLLYMPRGMVHEAESLPDQHSLHLTVSTNQQRTWGAFLEDLLPRALAEATQRSVALRRCLPRDFASCMGSIHGVSSTDSTSMQRRHFEEQAAVCMQVVADCLDLDWGADQQTAEFMLQRLPPVLPPRQPGAAKLSTHSTVRVVDPGVARLVLDAEGEEPVAVVCHCLSNTREQHAAGGKDDEEEAGGEFEIPPQIEFPVGSAKTLVALVGAEGQAGVKLGEVPPPDAETELSVVQVAQALVDAGLLVVVPDS